MSKFNFSDVAQKIIILLQNARKLAICGERSLALDTINSCKILCKSRNYRKIPASTFQRLEYAVKNYPPMALLESFNKIEEEILYFDVQ